MKKIISVLLVAMLVLASFSTVAFAAPAGKITVSSATAKAGDEVTLSFTISGDQFCNYGMWITADSALTLKSVQKGAACAGMLVPNLSTGMVTYAGYDNENGGVLFTATFKVAENAAPGEYPVSIRVDKVYNVTQQILSMTVVGGKVTVECGSHSWGAWTNTKNPTCNATGTAKRTCSACGETETKTLPVTDHTWGSWKTTTPAGCLEGGKAERSCSVCGKTEKKDLPAIGSHDWGNWTTTNPAGCLEGGKAERVCNRCGKTEKKDLPAVGSHAYGEWKTVTEPSCYTDGKAERTCSKCGEVESKVLEATGHIVDGGSNGKWSHDGKYHWHVCSGDCGELFDMAEHDLKWVITVNAGHNTTGLKHQECKVCGYVGEDVVIPAEPELDEVPKTDDNSVMLTVTLVSVLAVLLVAAYVTKRKYMK